MKSSHWNAPGFSPCERWHNRRNRSPPLARGVREITFPLSRQFLVLMAVLETYAGAALLIKRPGSKRQGKKTPSVLLRFFSVIEDHVIPGSPPASLHSESGTGGGGGERGERVRGGRWVKGKRGRW